MLASVNAKFSSGQFPTDLWQRVAGHLIIFIIIMIVQHSSLIGNDQAMYDMMETITKK